MPFLSLLFFGGLGFFLFSCATDKVARDLVIYVNQGILGIAELERSSLKRYASVRGENYTTDQRVYEALRDDVIPQYKRFLDLLREIKPETEEIRRLHGIYIRGAEYLCKGFKTKMLGLEKKDEHLIRLGNEQIEKGREENERWRNELLALNKAHNIKQEDE
jgi:hypothetical protein